MVRIAVLATAALALLAFGAARAAPGPDGPASLVINSQMHTSEVNDIAVNADGSVAMTVSDDKTARLWSLPSGQLIKVLRPPFGPGLEGELHAGALSPDGAVAAVSGRTGPGWGAGYCIYLLDTRTGQLIRRLPAAQSYEADTLTFSPDGRFLAAGMMGTGGLKVWRTDSWALVESDASYQRNLFALSFDRHDRLATAGADRDVRLYDADFHLLAKVAVDAQNIPSGVAFSPDGERLAVSFAVKPAVMVLSGRDLATQALPDVSGIAGFDGTRNVAWSADGQTLFAGPDKNLIRAWGDGGKGARRDIAAAPAYAVLLMFHVLPDGRLIFCGDQAGWGVAGGAQPLLKVSDIATVGIGLNFELSPDGKIVGFDFGFGKGDQLPARFTVPTRKLQQFDEDQPPLSPHPDAPSDNFFELHALGDIPPEAVSAKDAQHLLIAFDGELRLYSREDPNAQASGPPRFDPTEGMNDKHQLLWKSQVSDLVAAAAMSADERVAVVALNDGTIRWRRMSDGVEVLAYYPHPDGKRWVLWTPSGYYDTSPGADDLVAWVVGHGPDQSAGTAPSERFAARRRPDVIDRVLDTLDEATAVREADEARARSGH